MDLINWLKAQIVNIQEGIRLAEQRNEPDWKLIRQLSVISEVLWRQLESIQSENSR